MNFLNSFQPRWTRQSLIIWKGKAILQTVFTIINDASSVIIRDGSSLMSSERTTVQSQNRWAPRRRWCQLSSSLSFVLVCGFFSVEAQLESGSEIGDNHLSDIVLHMLLVIFNFVLDVFLICWILHFCQCWWIVLFVLGLCVQLWKLFGN